MSKTLLKRVLLPLLLMVSTPVLSSLTDHDRSYCATAARSFATSLSGVGGKLAADVRDLSRESGNWAARTGNYMYWAKGQSPNLTQRELETLGYSYCLGLS